MTARSNGSEGAGRNRVSTRWETAETAGLSNFLMAVMVKGTTRRSGAELAEAVANLGGKISASGEVDYSEIRASALARFWRELLGLTAELALEPRLAPEEVDRERDWLLSRVQRRLDNAPSRAFDELYALLYLPHPYGLPTLVTNCSNNYGPRQFPEKLIPLMIHRALVGKPLPVYGDGQNVRDWLYVEDHCTALRAVLEKGRLGDVYNIGGGAEMKNIDLVKTLCVLLDEAKPRTGGSYAALISFVKDRPGHDRRYAIDSRKIQRELGWRPAESFASGLRKTVRWYLDQRHAQKAA